MNTFETILNDINNIKSFYAEDESIAESLIVLHQQFNRAADARYTLEEMNELIKGENDICDTLAITDNLTDEDELHAQIRCIQDRIILFFAE